MENFINEKFLNNIKKGYRLEDKEEFQRAYKILVQTGMPTENFKKNLETLEITMNNNPDVRLKGEYRSSINKIILNDEKYMVHELFHMASSKGNYTTGVCYEQQKIIDGKLETTHLGSALNEGITEMFCILENPSYVPNYVFEEIVSETLLFIYQDIQIFKPYFENNKKEFVFNLDNDGLIEQLMYNLDNYKKYFELRTDLTLNQITEEEYDNIATKLKDYYIKVMKILEVIYKKHGKISEEEYEEFQSQNNDRPEMQEIISMINCEEKSFHR